MQCKAKSKQSGERCKRPATQAMEVCYIHGGKSLKGSDNPAFKHGRYAKFAPDIIAQKIEAFDDADPLDLLDELNIQRALFAEYLSRFVPRIPLPERLP